jgi:hypothetical protein
MSSNPNELLYFGYLLNACAKTTLPTRAGETPAVIFAIAIVLCRGEV